MLDEAVKQQQTTRINDKAKDNAISILEDMVTAGVISLKESEPIIETQGLQGTVVEGHTPEEYHYSVGDVDEFIKRDFENEYLGEIDSRNDAFSENPSLERLGPAFELICEARQTYSALSRIGQWHAGKFVAKHDKGQALETNWLEEIETKLNERKELLELKNNSYIMRILEGAEDFSPEKRSEVLREARTLNVRYSGIQKEVLDVSEEVTQRMRYLSDLNIVDEDHYLGPALPSKLSRGVRNEYHDMLDVDRKSKMDSRAIETLASARVLTYLDGNEDSFVEIKELASFVFPGVEPEKVSHHNKSLLYVAIGNVARGMTDKLIEYEVNSNGHSIKSIRMRDLPTD